MQLQYPDWHINYTQEWLTQSAPEKSEYRSTLIGVPSNPFYSAGVAHFTTHRSHYNLYYYTSWYRPNHLAALWSFISPKFHSQQSQWTAFFTRNTSFLSKSHISVGLSLTTSFISILYPWSFIPLQTRIWPHLRQSSWHDHTDSISGLLRKVGRLIYCIFCIPGNGSVSQHYQGSCCKVAIGTGSLS